MFRSPSKQFGSNPEIYSKNDGHDLSPTYGVTQRKRKHMDCCNMDLSDLKADITSMFSDIKSDLKSLHSDNLRIHTSISELKTQQQEVLAEFNEMKTTIEYVTDKQRDQEKQVADLTSKLSELEHKHTDYESLQNKYETLQSELDRQQQYARILNLEITGMPESKSENLSIIVINIAKHAGVEITYNDIDHVNRVRPMTQREGRPRAIIVKLKNRAHKNNILAGLRKTRGVSTTDIGLQGETRKLFVNDHLTPNKKQVLMKCKATANLRGYEHVWVRDCNIYARKSDGAPVVQLESLKDINKLL
jgi:hypothetical protein